MLRLVRFFLFFQLLTPAGLWDYPGFIPWTPTQVVWVAATQKEAGSYHPQTTAGKDRI